MEDAGGREKQQSTDYSGYRQHENASHTLRIEVLVNEVTLQSCLHGRAGGALPVFTAKSISAARLLYLLLCTEHVDVKHAS